MKPVYLVAGGDRRLAANQQSWPGQSALELRLTAAVERLGHPVQRAQLFDGRKEHGFIDTLKMGLAVFREIPVDAPVIVPVSVRQCGPHLWPGLVTHEGPILTVAKWGGEPLGSAGMLNLNGWLTRAGVKYSSLWSETFEDPFFSEGLRRWLERGKIKHDTEQVRAFDLKPKDAPADLGDAMRTGRDFARRLRQEKTILGVFDDDDPGLGCATVPGALLSAAGVFKQRLNPSELTTKVAAVSEAEARAVCEWGLQHGRRCSFARDEATGLTEARGLDQSRRYVAVVRSAEEFGCAAVGFRSWLGWDDPTRPDAPVEDLFNRVERPPVYHEATGEELFPGDALPHFSGGDECAGLDGLVTYRLWRELGYPPENTAYELRGGQDFRDERTDAFVWIFQAGGGALLTHLGNRGQGSRWQPPAMGLSPDDKTPPEICKPGWIVWSRVYLEDERRLCYDTGIAEAVSLPVAQAEDGWLHGAATRPVLQVVLQGITRDQMLARQKAGCVQVVYAPDKEGARRGLFAKAAAMRELGLEVSICGNISGER